MRQVIEGLILSQNPYGESDKFLTVLTREYGKIDVCAKHVRHLLRGSAVYTIPMQYCRFELKKKGDIFLLAGGEVIYSFVELGDALDTYGLATYILDIAKETALTNNDETALLRLVLNTLYMIQHKKASLAHIKATFEFRVMAISGYAPDLSCCSFCQNSVGPMFLDIMNGRIICPQCQKKRNESGITEHTDMGTAVIVAELTPAMLSALRYVISADDKRVFAYSMPPEEEQLYAEVCEKYILNHLERGFRTLDFYKRVTSM